MWRLIGYRNSATETGGASEGLDQQVLLGPDSLGPLYIGMPIEDAVETGILGPFREGCPIPDPPTQVAELLPPLEGYVTTWNGEIIILQAGHGILIDPGGATAGDTLEEFTAAMQPAGFSVEIDYGAEEMFEVWFVFATNAQGESFVTMADPDGDHRIGYVGTDLGLCE